MISCPGPLTCTFNCCDTQGQCPSSADLCFNYYPRMLVSEQADSFYINYILIPSCVIFGLICIVLIARQCYIRRQ